MNEAYLYIKYKILYGLPERFQSFGLMTPHDFYSKALEGKFDHSVTANALAALAKDGLVDINYVYECPTCKSLERVREEHPSTSTSLVWIRDGAHECSFCNYKCGKGVDVELLYSLGDPFIEDKEKYFESEEDRAFEEMRHENPMRRIVRWLKNFF